MRLLEFILLSISTALPLLLSFTAVDHHKKRWLIGLSLIFTLHLTLEGYRWQLIPCYILILLVLLMIYRNWRFTRKGKMSIIYGCFLTIFLITPAWILPNIFPIFTLPVPTGAYQIGSQYLLISTSFDEIIIENTNDQREFMIKVWYPAMISNEAKEMYLDRGNRAGFSNKYGLPESLMNYMDHIKTNTYVSPKIENKRFPVLIFSHGLYSEAYGCYGLIEEIVSQGFIVMNINHTYESSGSLFPNGEVLLFNSEFDRKNNDLKMAEMAWNASQNYDKAANEEEQFLAVEDLIRTYVGAEITNRWSRDVSALIDYLEVLNTDSFLSKHLDLSKIGAFGHSQGGSAIGQVMLEDDRISSGINLDGVQWGNMIDNTLNKPFLLISSDWPSEHMDLNKFAYRNLSKDCFQKIIIKDSGHSNFMDIPLLVNFPFINEAGTLNPKKGYRKVSGIIINFFNNTLNSKKDGM